MVALETYNGHYLWQYLPSRPGGIAAAAVFGILTLGHLFRMFRHRMWFCIPFVVGGICKSDASLGPGTYKH